MLQANSKPAVPNSRTHKPLIVLEHVSKTFQTPSGAFRALRDVNLEVQAGEFVAIVGKSGSGKSTLINLMTGIDSPTVGEIMVGSVAVHALNQEQLAIWRGKNVGVIFQFFQLLPTLTILENTMLPMDFCNTYPAYERRERAELMLKKLGILEQAAKLPADLSGGQQQRAAIARALVNDPPLLVADEPTGNLDSKTSEDVMGLFTSLVNEGKTVLMVTHERDFGRFFTRSINLADGIVLPETNPQFRQPKLEVV
jgi:putative ABC transport system ATP-binding protein